jgi:hypothetical protein
VKPSEKVEKQGLIDAGTLTLFPAAKVWIEPVATNRMSVSSHWRLTGGNQPAWAGKIQAVDKDRNLEFATVFWLNLNERQPIFVPAESRYRLQLRTPYADEWGDVLMRDQPALPAGGEFERGEVVFPACLRVAVRVTDPSGTPVEGIPVRLIQEQSRVSTVAHNTTAAGDAFFFIDPNSSGHFFVSELRGKFDDFEKQTAKFKVSDANSVPKDPYLIVLIKEQIAFLLGE